MFISERRKKKDLQFCRLQSNIQERDALKYDVQPNITQPVKHENWHNGEYCAMCSYGNNIVLKGW